MDSWTVFEWELDVQNTLKDVALPVHLLRQVFFGGSSALLWRSWASFFSLFSSMSFYIVFFSIFGGLWRVFGGGWRGFGRVWGVFWEGFGEVWGRFLEVKSLVKTNPIKPY